MRKFAHRIGNPDLATTRAQLYRSSRDQASSPRSSPTKGMLKHCDWRACMHSLTPPHIVPRLACLPLLDRQAFHSRSKQQPLSTPPSRARAAPAESFCCCSIFFPSSVQNPAHPPPFHRPPQETLQPATVHGHKRLVDKASPFAQARTAPKAHRGSFSAPPQKEDCPSNDTSKAFFCTR